MDFSLTADCDGKAEVIVRTSNGVIFGNGAIQSGGASDNVQFLSIVNGGTIYLAGTTANVSGLGNGTVTITNGTLTMANVQASETAAWNLIVPTGATARLNADGRCFLTGSLTGAGNFTYYSPYVRSELKGNWSTFTGQINLATDADGSEMRVTNSYGFGTAALNIGADRLRSHG